MQKMSVLNLLSMLDRADLNLISKRETSDKKTVAGEETHNISLTAKQEIVMLSQTPDRASEREMPCENQTPDQMPKQEMPEACLTSKSQHDEKKRAEIRGASVRMCMSGGNRKAEASMCRTQIAAYQLDILKHNSITGLLQVSCLQESGNIRLYYNIDGLSTFADAIFNDKLSRIEVLRLLEQVTACAKSLHHYLLEPDNLILDPSFMFFNDNKEIMMMCLPLKSDDWSKEAPEYRSGEYLNHLKETIRFAIHGSELVEDMLREAESVSQMAYLINEQLSAEFYKRQEAADPETVNHEPAEVHKWKKQKISAENILCFLNKKNKYIKEYEPDDEYKLKQSRENKIIFIGVQLLLILIMAVVYMLHILKPIDFAGFFIVAVATDTWVIRSIRKTEESSGLQIEKRQKI